MASGKDGPKLREINLLKLFDELNRKYFGGIVCGGIGWRPLHLGKDIKLAECTFRERFVAVNTMLQDKRFPVWYVKAVVYHEMLHLHLGPQQFEPDGFSYPHCDRFMSIESKYPDFEKSQDFERTKLRPIADDWVAWRQNKVKHKKKIP